MKEQVHIQCTMYYFIYTKSVIGKSPFGRCNLVIRIVLIMLEHWDLIVLYSRQWTRSIKKPDIKYTYN